MSSKPNHQQVHCSESSSASLPVVLRSGISKALALSFLFCFIAGVSQTFAQTTQISAADCGKTNFVLSDKLSADPIPGGIKYCFEFTNPNSTVLGSVVENSEVVQFNNTSLNFVPGQTYTVRVKVYKNSLWSNYGGACAIGFQLPKLDVPFCGGTFPKNHKVSSIAIPGAVSYTFRFKKNNNIIATAVSATRTIALDTPQLSMLSVNETYQVLISVNGSWGTSSFGAACGLTVTNPTPITNNAGIVVKKGLKTLQGGSEDEVTIFPTPASDKLFVQFELQGSAAIIVRDIAGRIMLQKTVTGEGLTMEALDVASFASGTYIISVANGTKAIIVKKFIKE